MTGPIEVPGSDGGIIVHAKPGGTILLAFSGDVPPDRARKVVDQIAEGSPDCRVIALAGVDAVRSWHPSDAPAALAAALAENRLLRNWLDDLTHVVIDLGEARVVRAAEAVRKKAGLPPVED